MDNKLIGVVGAVGLLLCVAVQAQGAPLDLTKTVPDITAQFIGVNYTASSGAFSAIGTPLAIDFDGVAPPDKSITALRSYSINVLIDNSGVLLGGIAGDDFQVTGNIDMNGDNNNDYTGILLKGEVVNFGCATGIIEFTFTINGGVLQSMFGPTVGTILTPTSGFEGSFAANFTNRDSYGVGYGVADNFPVPVPAPGAVSVFSLGVLGLLVRRRADR